MRKIFLIPTLLVLILITLPSCNLLNRDNGQSPWDCSGTIQILYERVLPVKNSWADDIPGGGNILLPTGQLIGFDFIKVGKNKYKAEVDLHCSPHPYEIWVFDGKVILPSEYRSVARKLYLRIKGETDWLELTCILPTYLFDKGSEEAKFIYEGGVIKNPDPCE